MKNLRVLSGAPVAHSLRSPCGVVGERRLREMVGRNDGLFQPDVVLAPQFFATLRRQAPRKQGECQLLIAVLEDAINCFQKYVFAGDTYGRRLFQEAEQWMMEKNPERPPSNDEEPSLSFEYVCEVLGLDPDYLRHGLRRWRDAQVAHARSQSGSNGHAAH
jgi:hypothetical protein